MKLRAFAQGDIDQSDFDLVGVHVEKCPSCEERLAALEGASDDLVKNLRQALRHPGLQPGHVLGEYELLSPLGAGGMGRVWTARHRRMDRTVALKVIAQNRTVFNERFQREVESLASLSHPNIAAAYDAGEHDGRPYLVMEHLHGQDLDHLMAVGPLPTAQACDCALQAAEGLAHAHARGIIHRDVKPANLFLTVDGMVKVLDLGLARRGNESDHTVPSSDGPRDTRLTTATTIMGTLDYAAPEQLESAALADEKADVYSLGCTLHALLGGSSPFARANLEETVAAHRGEPRPPLPHVPSRINALLDRMTAKDPKMRPAMAEVAAALRPRPRRRGLGAGIAIAVVAILASIFLIRPKEPAPPVAPAPLAAAPSTGDPAVLAGLTSTMTAEEATEFQARYAKARGLPVEIQNRAGMVMVLIPPGEISVPKLANRSALRVSRSEVTLAEFRFFVKLTKYVPESTRNGGGNIAERKADGSGYLLRQRNGVTWEAPGVTVENSDTSPVTQISWNDATAFCAWLSTLDGHTYRLPTMAEHEWFARAGVRSSAYYGQSLEDYDRQEVSNRSVESRPRPVGSRRANAWGLCDTRGNVGEWLSDTKPENAIFRAVANGTYVERPPQLFRNSWWFEKGSGAHIGFRVVTEVPP